MLKKKFDIAKLSLVGKNFPPVGWAVFNVSTGRIQPFVFRTKKDALGFKRQLDKNLSVFGDSYDGVEYTNK